LSEYADFPSQLPDGLQIEQSEIIATSFFSKVLKPRFLLADTFRMYAFFVSPSVLVQARAISTDDAYQLSLESLHREIF